jgi:4-alpha-glucanotransferase
MTDTGTIGANHAAHLHRLADAVGIEGAYHDIYGTRHDASPASLIALLGALGLAAATEAEAAASLEAVAAQRWASPMPAATVLRQGSGSAFAVSLAVPDTALTQTLAWTIALEDGTTRAGRAEAAALTVEDLAEVTGRAMARLRLPLPADLPAGYHRFRLDAPTVAEGLLVVAPPQCYAPPLVADGKRVWGLGCQLYALRSATNWGMGDFADLARLGTAVGRLGGATLGLNPLHALFSNHPEDASPYSPNSRLFLNPLYIAIAEVPEFAACADLKAWLDDPETSRALATARAADLVDYPRVHALKRAALEMMFQTFEAEAPPARRTAFDAFLDDGGERLRLFAVFQLLQETYPDRPWPQWPEEMRSPASPAVSAVAEARANTVRFHLWLQFEADRQLAAASRALAATGDSLGLYRDLAVGVNPDGADAWMDPDAYVRTARFGAPPDDLGPLGQDWGLPPLNPQALTRAAYGPFIDMLRANMRHAGALRIDHAMALQHLFWIPPGQQATEGVYVSYPMDDLMGILALESHRNRCLVIGEDLGTVPDGFRERMAEENVLSYRLLYFERYDSGLFKRPEAYPSQALATATSHDMATIPGNWEGWDIALRHRLDLTRPDQSEDEDQEARGRDRQALIAALADQGLLAASFPTGPTLGAGRMASLTLACHRFLARTPSQIMLINIDDLAGEVSQVNVPGTVSAYANWRRRLARDLDDLLADPALRETAMRLTDDRA